MDPKITQQNKNNVTPQEVIPSFEDLMKRDKLYITIKSPDKTVFSGEGVALSSVNDVGPFDVLPRHENFISILGKKVVIFQEKNNKQEFEIEKGIIKARQNRVQIFLGIETLGQSETQVFQNETTKTAGVLEKETNIASK